MWPHDFLPPHSAYLQGHGDKYECSSWEKIVTILYQSMQPATSLKQTECKQATNESTDTVGAHLCINFWRDFMTLNTALPVEAPFPPGTKL